MTAVLFAVAILSPEACEQVRAKLLSLRPLPARESESARVAREAADAYHREVLAPILAEQDGCELCLGDRVEVDFGVGVGLVHPCRACRSAEYADFVRRQAVANGVDPWDLPETELNHTVALPRETPAYWGGDRGDFDELDDKSDLLPQTRTSKP